MPRPQPGARAPLFDRLIDEEPRVSHETPVRRLLDASRFAACVKRDVEDLLNTRRNLGVWREDTRRTALSFGAGDLTGLSSHSATVRARLAAEVAEALAAFEPRLSAVEVSAPHALNEHTAGARLRAKLRIGRVHVPIEWTLQRIGDRLAITEDGVE